MPLRGAFSFQGQAIPAGSRATVPVPLPGQSRFTPTLMPVHIVHGKRNGPTLFVTAAIHGDEIGGIDIVRRLLRHTALKRLKGTLIAVPVVNMYGFLQHMRYLPDRRDLNRSFPGREQGSLAARVAHVLRTEIIDRSDYGVDLHTGANHRTNFPHIRANLNDPETKKLAHAFNTAVIVNANLRDGSLRQYALEAGKPVLLYEAGEAFRFDPTATKAGVRGLVGVLAELGMIAKRRKPKPHATLEALSSHWVRASRSGIVTPTVKPGDRVLGGQRLASISDLTGEDHMDVLAEDDGMVLGMNQMPNVNEGDALFHIAMFKSPARAEVAVDAFHLSLEGLGEEDYPAHVPED
ncbi:succinylglutamate desuccinylase/aspartoacylase family protein [Eilatimonas milleporae]|uniref:Succinylglutamate desuccinylase/Aspartoacylase catalytic domain-containing protein n=1 Tax=Eilatimonas milleporae TaxID=911205 RepID=A0A3M0C4V7_9PROT|nr:succinylglutamate desuccinylase/aspartoacylase family protein [Eilatimonas milleporae]RMB04854.1 hypothetical protein BXY39_2424 [Eilatimonas milleporae]